MKITKHAEIRCQQRGILSEAVDLIVQFGRPVRKPGNVLEFRLVKRDRERIITHLKRQIQTIDKTLNKAVLVDADEEEIITAYVLKGQTGVNKEYVRQIRIVSRPGWESPKFLGINKKRDTFAGEIWHNIVLEV